MNWESIGSNYEQIKELIVECYPKTNEESKDFPNLQNPEVILKDIEKFKCFLVHPYIRAIFFR